MGPATVDLRPATAADLPPLVALLADDPLGAERETAADDLEPYRRALELVDGDPAHVLVVAAVSGVPVGTLQLSFLPGLARRGVLRAQIEADHGSATCGRATLLRAVGVRRLARRNEAPTVTPPGAGVPVAPRQRPCS